MKRAAPAASPSNVKAPTSGTPTRSGRSGAVASGAHRLHGSAGSGPAARATARAAAATSDANTDTQSSDRHAGTTPRLVIRPRVGLIPTIPLQAAGTRPEPAVSVPRARSTIPVATATADPLLDPPGMSVAQ